MFKQITKHLMLVLITVSTQGVFAADKASQDNQNEIQSQASSDKKTAPFNLSLLLNDLKKVH